MPVSETTSQPDLSALARQLQAVRDGLVDLASRQRELDGIRNRESWLGDQDGAAADELPAAIVDAFEAELEQARGKHEENHRRLVQACDRERAKRREQAEADKRRLRVNLDDDGVDDALTRKRQEALAEASARRRDFEEALDALSEALTRATRGLPQLEQTSGRAAKLAEHQLEEARTIVSQRIDSLAEAVASETALMVRIKASPVLSIFIQILVAALAAVAAWLLWERLPLHLLAIVVGGGWVGIGLLFFVERARRLSERRKGLLGASQEAADLAVTIDALRQRLATELDPEQAVTAVLDELIRQQEAHQAKMAKAQETARIRMDSAAKELRQRLQEVDERQASEAAKLERQWSAFHAQWKERRQRAGEEHRSGQQADRDARVAGWAATEQAIADDRQALLRGARDIVSLMEHQQGVPAPWTEANWLPWQDPSSLPDYIPLGRVGGPLAVLAEGPMQEALAEDTLDVPLALSLPERGHLLLRCELEAGRAMLHQAMIRLLGTAPAGRIRFTVFDPKGLGERFARFLRLVEHDERLLGSKIWTSQTDIETQLANTSEYAEKIIQKYLRDRFADLASYNADAGDLAEPYMVLVIADFPHGFSPSAIERLASLVEIGPRCGIYCWLQADPSQPFPKELSTERFHEAGIVLRQGDDAPVVDDGALEAFPVQALPMPDDQLVGSLLDAIGSASAASANRAVSLDLGLPSPQQRWSADSASDFRLPIGRSGADRLQYMELGHGTAQHVLIGGRTGSGKSTLLHILITNGAAWYGPDQLAFYLVDFKKGVEFKTYANQCLPHAKVIAVESDREYALSVLRTIDAELEERGVRFREAGVQDLAAFRQARPDVVMPRSLLIVDEFHEFFSEDDGIARDAALLLERFVRQGRAFGIHIVLGSQSIGGSLGLARSAIGQMGVRIALQCNEADSQLILSEENLAARLLERPGEAIYNGRSGLPAGNDPFQVFWMDEAEQETLLGDLAAQAPAGLPKPWVFEGNAPAELPANRSLTALLEAPMHEQDARPWIWLGEPNAIKDPTEQRFARRPGSNLLVVGHNRSGVYGMAEGALASLASRFAPGSIRLLVVDAGDEDDRIGERLAVFAQALPHDVSVLGTREGAEAIAALGAEVASGSVSVPTVLLVLGLGRMRALRPSDEFAFSSGDSEPSPGDRFVTLLEEGPDLGCHSFVWCESATVVRNAIQRKTMACFDHRCCFQMSAGDSADLIDDSGASRLGLHHALLVDIEEVRQEKFRPYIPMESDRAATLAAAIAGRHS